MRANGDPAEQTSASQIFGVSRFCGCLFSSADPIRTSRKCAREDCVLSWETEYARVQAFKKVRALVDVWFCLQNDTLSLRKCKFEFYGSEFRGSNTDSAYRLELRQNLYIMLGGAAGALAGLLFIAMSLQIRAIAKDSVLRARAWANTFMIVMLAINAAAILVPQSITALGVELCLTAVLYVPFFVLRTLRVKRITKTIPRRAFISTFYPVAGIFGGVSLIFQFGGGMYIVAAQSVAILAWVIFNAWSLMLAASAEDVGAAA